jgi:rhamnosyltransferase
MSTRVTVAIPTLDGGPGLERTLDAVRAQRLDGTTELELLVCDSGSSDGSVALARRYGAEVIEIAPQRFSHGGTRNLLMERSRGTHVAFLTQDAVPASEDWLHELLSGFALAADVGLTFGPYRPRPDASVSVARELTAWFESFSDDEWPRIDVLSQEERTAPARDFVGHRGFFTDANGCVARAAWERVPFRDIAYAEDHLLAQDMLRAGYAKVYVPTAAVVHSHDYSLREWLRRSFDEARAMREVYGWAQPAGPRTTGLDLWGKVGADWRWWRAAGTADRARPGGSNPAAVLGSSALHHTARTAGTLLGARAQRLPPKLARRLSLERRAD